MRTEPVAPSGRAPALVALAGVLTVLLALPLAALAGAPYLVSDHVNGWIVLFAVGLLALLVAVPFALEQRLRERQPDRDRRWELAVLLWGGIALVLGAAAFLLGQPAGFSGSSLGGTVGLLGAVESLLVVTVVGAWLLSN